MAESRRLGEGRKGEAYRLIRACSSSVQEASALLEREPSLLNERTGLGETALHYLAVEDHLVGVRFLHEKGASLDVRNRFDETPLRDALSLRHTQVAEYLL